jgi:hypothetical protein
MTSNDIVVDVVGGGNQVKIAGGKTAIVGFDPTGVYRVTNDV